MTVEVITSRGNARARAARAVRDGRERGLIFIEGVRLCEEATRSALQVADVLYTQRLAGEERGARLLEAFEKQGCHLAAVSEDVFASISDTKTPQGVVALAHRPRTERDVLENIKVETRTDVPLIVMLHCVNNPSNAGAMLRVAEAAGATGVIATEGSTDLFSPKALRGAMGSSFRLPIWHGASFNEALAWCAAHKIQTVATDLRAPNTHTEIDWTRARAVVFGEEGGGLDRAEVEATDIRIRIPMRPPVESLNVAAALAVVLYEAARQRQDI